MDGERDQAVPVTHGRWLAAHIPDMDAHIEPGDDHSNVESDHRCQAYAWIQQQAGLVTQE